MTVSIRHLATTQADFEAEFQRVLHWSAETDHAIEERVAAILAGETDDWPESAFYMVGDIEEARSRVGEGA